MKAYLIGGDSREKYLAYQLERKGIEIIHPEQVDRLKDKKADFIVLPTPVTMDRFTVKATEGQRKVTLKEILEITEKGQPIFGGMFPAEFRKALEEKGAVIYDFMKMDDIAIQNAVATAEGAIAEAVFMSNEVIHGQEVLVLGYGRCAEVLADKLKGMAAKVTVMARREEARSRAWTFGNEILAFDDLQEIEKFHYIFNTVPSMCITKDWIDRLNRYCCIVDIASKPGGVDFDYCSKKGIRAKLCGSLPGRYAPKTSGELLAKKIESILKETQEYGYEEMS
ncbi:MAG: dipicolinate synthase subunit DpsA [Lachnospiraceae bacterium]|nr:dipicolinate synthase subunit DpsA [Lachnospiraceae bacterium]